MSEGHKLNRAMVRLEAFKILDGWGSLQGKEGKEVFTIWTFDQRKEKAEALADWAMGEPS